MISFRIEGIPPSYNKHLNINYNFREVYLSREAKQFKNLIKMSIPPATISTLNVYSMEVEYHSNFKYKNGKNKKIDLQNMDKLLIDAIFEKLGVDDSYLWQLNHKKIQNDTENYTKVIINTI